MKRLIFLFSIILLSIVSNSCQKEADFATIYGVVSDSKTGEPIKDANVVLTPSGRNYTTKTDGKFEFDELDPQQYTVTVYKTDYKTEYETIVALADSRIERNIKITKKP